MQRYVLLSLSAILTMAFAFAPTAFSRPLQVPGGAAQCVCPLGYDSTPIVNPPPCAMGVGVLWNDMTTGSCTLGNCGPASPCSATVRMKLTSSGLPGCNWIVLDPYGRSESAQGTVIMPPVTVVIDCGDFATFNIFADGAWLTAVSIICRMCPGGGGGGNNL